MHLFPRGGGGVGGKKIKFKPHQKKEKEKRKKRNLSCVLTPGLGKQEQIKVTANVKEQSQTIKCGSHWTDITATNQRQSLASVTAAAC